MAQSRQKKQRDQHSRKRGVKLGDAVSVRNYSRGSKWVRGTGASRTRRWNCTWRHHDQLIFRTAEPLCPSPTAQRAGHSNEGSVVPEVSVPDVNSPK